MKKAAATGKKNSTKKDEKIIVTAALPYANGPIHIGHLLEYIQADIYTRFLKLQGKDALYICASDMHGTPIEVNAAKAKKDPEKFANEFWKDHQQDFASFLIQFDNYYKTHSPENKELAEHFFTELKKQGYISTKKINVIYCEHCARSLPDRYVKGTCPYCTTLDQYGDVCESCSSVLKGNDLINPKCALCGRTPIQKESEHYFFKLSAFSKRLEQWITSPTAHLQPEVRNWLKEWITKGLEDWCISRDAPYFGFEIPGSKDETGEVKYFYVWMDAPIGYISSTKNYCDRKKVKWEEYWIKGKVHHFIGKDISYFHFLFWPAMLMAMNIPLPALTVHGFITVDGQKMSKSRGTFFTAKDFLKLYPAESLRFFYASHLDRRVIDVDLNFNDFIALNNNVLMGNVGNFCYRVLTFAEKNYASITTIAENQEITVQIKSLIEEIRKNYFLEDFKGAVKNILKIADLGNAYFQKSEVWKDPQNAVNKAAVGWCVNVARDLGIMVSPILPAFSAKIQAAVGKEQWDWDGLSFNWKGKVKPTAKLVEKIEVGTPPHTTEEVRVVRYSVDPVIEEMGVKVRVAQLSGVHIKKKHEGIERIKDEVRKNIANYERHEILEEYANIDRKTGVDSRKNPNAVINLIKLIREKGKLPQINTVVDLYNAVSVESNIAMATHDLSKLDEDIEVRFCREGESFLSLDGTTEKLKEGEIVYSDKKKIIGRFSKQCKQTITTIDSTNLVLVAFGNTKISEREMEQAVQRACELITKYNGGEYKLLPTMQIRLFPLYLVVGKILAVKDHPNADSLYLLQVDLGPELGKKQVVAGLKKSIPKDLLLNRQVVFCANMKPAKIRGELSEAMIMVGDDRENVAPLEVKKTKIGEEVHFEGVENSHKEVTFEEFKKLELFVRGGRVFFEGKKLASKVEEVICHGVKDGSRIF